MLEQRELATTRLTPVLSLQEIGAGDIALAGEEAVRLGRMLQAGLPVPPGFVVTEGACDEFLRRHRFREVAEGLLAVVDPGSGQAVDEAARQMRDIVMNAPVPAALRDAIQEAHAHIGGGRVQITLLGSEPGASGNARPSYGYLGANGHGPAAGGEYVAVHRESFVQAVQRCWADAFSIRSIYGDPRNAPGSAALVRRLVEPEVSGIMWTSHRDSDHMMITAMYGASQSRSSVAGDRYIVRRSDLKIASRSISAQAWEIRHDRRGKLQAPVPTHCRNLQKLRDRQISTLARIGLRTEAVLGPQIVEWVLGEGQLLLTGAADLRQGE